ncbi:GDSL esterase/lipase At4g10955-like [Macadamia integrifolia]|uniref:GDSL esterase/lipase At4g10955-like n=1 Tax=Macadamia integrifolia TaxID=60698 RepID=UPI001C5276A5|nr:GDSL esterase/lipase At4g10955-like [Macadamia integrifolia]
MASESYFFSLLGALHLTAIDWNNEHHCRSVAASLVQGVNALERDRQQNRKGADSLAPAWWEFFHFQLVLQLRDEVDSSIFGSIFEFKPKASNCHYSIQEAPRYVIAFRGTVINPNSCIQEDLRLGFLFTINELHGTSRFKVAMEAIKNKVDVAGALNIWLAGHSLGSAMAMLAGKNMAKTGFFLQAFLFNPPFSFAPIERIEDKTLRQGIRIAKSFITAGLTVAIKGHQSEDPFVVLSPWIPCLFVNPADDISSEYVGYFEHRKKMEEIGASKIEELASQNSTRNLLLGKTKSEPLHLLPSTNLTINFTPSPDFVRAHGIRQWWRPDLHMHFKLYQYRWKKF